MNTASNGSDFLENVTPKVEESVIEKSKSSAFTDTNLAEALTNEFCTEVILVGSNANECIDATARDAAALGFTAFLVSDVTATFDLRDATGKLVKAERIHKLTMLNINASTAKVLTTKETLAS